MTRTLAALLLAAAAASALAACSSSSNSSSSAAQAQLSRISAAEHQASASSSAGPGASSSAAPQVDPATIDVCGLLTQQDANSAARTEQFDALQDASTVYRLTVTKVPAGGAASSCKFAIDEVGGDAQGATFFQVTAAGDFTMQYSNGTKIDGLGDEAYDSGDSPVVRVGSLAIKPVGDSFPDALTVQLLREMAPKLKQRLGGS